MSTIGFISFLRWWLNALVNARLRPMFCRWKAAERDGDESRAIRFELLFLKLLNHTDCYPFCVEVGQGLWVLDEPSSDDWGMGDETFLERVSQVLDEVDAGGGSRPELDAASRDAFAAAARRVMGPLDSVFTVPACGKTAILRAVSEYVGGEK